MNTAALRVAREALGYTQTDLAAVSGLQQTELSRWERGLRTPTHQQVATLADYLDVPIEFLNGEERVTQPVHRTQRFESKRTERLVNGRLELARRSASKLLEDIVIEPPYGFPTLDDSLSGDPEEAAAALRRVWRIPRGPIADLTDVVESAGVVVLPVDFGADNIRAAYVNPRGDHRWCFLNTQSEDGATVRFDLAHELGHALLHWDRFDAPTGKDAEAQAHRFAAALLMPADDIRAVFARTGPGLLELVTLRKQWGVSVQALVRRARDLEDISDQTYTRLYKQMSARGWRSARGEPGKLPVERPTILADALAIQRGNHGYSEQELATIAGLPHARLCDLLPDFFSPIHRKPTLRAVNATEPLHGRSDLSNTTKENSVTEGDIHTVHRDGKWLNEVEGGQRASNSAATKAEAEAQAKGREMAKHREVEHQVHRLDGTIGERNSYGNDPSSSKG